MQKYLICLLLIAGLQISHKACAGVPSEDVLKAKLPGTWLIALQADDMKVIGTSSYSTDGTVEYRLREAGADQDTARWTSRYTVKQNCIEDVVIETSDEEFAALGEKDRECVTDVQLDGRRMQFQTAKGDRAWAIKVTDEPGDDRCLQQIKPPICRRSSFLRSPGTVELKDGQIFATSTFEVKISGSDWAGILREKRADSDIRLVMLADGTNAQMIMTSEEKVPLEQGFQAYLAPISQVAPDFAKSPVQTMSIRLASGERAKILHSCGAIPAVGRTCIFAGQAKAGLYTAGSYLEGETSVLEMVKSIRLLPK